MNIDMKSPFPGMDPYLEESNLWRDVHLTLIIAMRGALNAALPKGYSALADRYVWIHEPDAGSRTRVVQPDAIVVEESPRAAGSAGATISAPQQIILPATRREGNKYLKILDAQSRRLVTVIELLSPTNKKPGPDRDAYVMKRIDYLTAGVNLVEIDLHRAGERIPLGEPLPAGFNYYALVCRAREMPKAGVWPFTIRDPIPAIPIPLAGKDADVVLDLAACLEWSYDQGRYERAIDYTQPPDPPLAPADVEWARQLLANVKTE